MASLVTILKNRAPIRVEDNLETGQVWLYTAGTEYTNFNSGFCWRAPGTGTAVIEAWGAGGPGSRMCCCGYGLPGNAGAYVKKTITVQSGCYICGSVGFPAYASSLCFSGCGDASCICWFGCGTNGCICARGGRGGTSFCSTGTSAWCCYYANGFCGNKCNGDNCGLICNHCSGGWEAIGFGGDVNCCGQIGCTSFFGCYPTCFCYYYYHVPTGAGMFAENGVLVTYTADSDGTPSGNWSGNSLFGYFTSLNSASRAPHAAHPVVSCWRSDRSCGCYEMQGCNPYTPIASGGLPPQPCGDVRDHGVRGGWGAVRIRFY